MDEALIVDLWNQKNSYLFQKYSGGTALGWQLLVISVQKGENRKKRKQSQVPSNFKNQLGKYH